MQLSVRSDWIAFCINEGRNHRALIGILNVLLDLVRCDRLDQCLCLVTVQLIFFHDDEVCAHNGCLIIKLFDIDGRMCRRQICLQRIVAIDNRNINIIKCTGNLGSFYWCDLVVMWIEFTVAIEVSLSQVAICTRIIQQSRLNQNSEAAVCILGIIPTAAARCMPLSSF